MDVSGTIPFYKAVWYKYWNIVRVMQLLNSARPKTVNFADYFVGHKF